MMPMSWKQINEHINKNGPEIIRRLVPLLMSAHVLRELVKEQVLLDHEELSLRHKQDPLTRCTTFLDLLKAGSVQKYYNMVKVAELNKQTDLVKLLEAEPEAQIPAPMVQPSGPLAQQPTPMTQQYTTMTQEPASMAQQLMQQDATMAPQPAAMAVQAGEKEVPIWDRNHPDGQEALLFNKELEDKLVKALPNLKKVVRPGDMWANLQMYGVMDSSAVSECKVAGNGAPGPQVEAIVDYLRKDKVWKVHAFLRSLAHIDQDHIIDMMLGRGAKETYNKSLMQAPE